jgi:hypothetical protein
MEFFQKFVTLTENPINFDVTYSVILGTVKGEETGHYLNNDLTFYFSHNPLQLPKDKVSV